MAAYRRVYDSRHLQADCRELGNRVWATFLGKAQSKSYWRILRTSLTSFTFHGKHIACPAVVRILAFSFPAFYPRDPVLRLNLVGPAYSGVWT